MAKKRFSVGDTVFVHWVSQSLDGVVQGTINQAVEGNPPLYDLTVNLERPYPLEMKGVEEPALYAERAAAVVALQKFYELLLAGTSR